MGIYDLRLVLIIREREREGGKTYSIESRSLSSMRTVTACVPSALAQTGTNQRRIAVVCSATSWLILSGSIFFFSYASAQVAISSSHCKPSLHPLPLSYPGNPWYSIRIASPIAFQKTPMAHFSTSDNSRHSHLLIHLTGSLANRHNV